MALLLVLAAVAAGGTIYALYGENKAQPLLSGDVQPDVAQLEDVPPGNALSGSGENFLADSRQTAVYVTGEVRSPGVVYVAFDSRVADAVNACGGVLPTADLNKVNMAQPVKDGLHIKVPEKQVAVGNASASAGEGRPGAAGNAGNAGNAGSGNGSWGAGSSAKGYDAGAETGREQAAGQADKGGELVNINTADAGELTRLKGIGPAMARRIVEYREENGAFQSPEELQRVKGIGKVKFAKLKEQIVL